jgi:hypothetical protein
MPEVTFIENGELCHATAITLVFTRSDIDMIQRLADDGNEIATLLWTAIELDREEGGLE